MEVELNSYVWQLVEIGIGVQFLFWGLNGFFNWIKPPENGKVFSNFIDACCEIRFLMISIKSIQIISGILLTIQFYPQAGLVLLLPIVFGITLLQVFHAKNPWPVLVPLIIPFYIVLIQKIPSLLS